MLFEKLIALSVEKEISYLFLTATDMGAPLYEKFSFQKTISPRICYESVWELSEPANNKWKPSLSGYSSRLATKSDCPDLAKLTSQAENSSDLAFFRHFYEYKWSSSSNNIILLCNDKNGAEIVGMVSLVLQEAMPSLPYNKYCIYGFVCHFIIKAGLRYFN